MTPDILTIPVMPESRLKAMIQVNALVHAIASAACFLFRHPLTKSLALPSPLFAICLGFAFAFHATFLFRISFKEPLPRPLVIASAIINLIAAVFVTIILVLHLLKFTPLGAKLLVIAAILHSIIAIALLFFTFHSSYTYSPTEVIAF